MPRTPSDHRGATLRVRVQPRASREAVLGWREDALRLAVTAAPVDGEANEAVRRLLARALGVAPSSVSLVRGGHGRDKVLRVEGMTGEELRSRLADRAVER
jgi:uncharacterized protein